MMTIDPMPQAACAEINLSAIRHNFNQLRRFAPNSRVLAVVKANAYGHGLLEVTRTLDSADIYAVARIEEALILRSGGIVKPIILLEGFFHPSDLPILATNNLHTVVHNIEQLEALERAKLDLPIQVWLKINTGMHRLGIQPEHCAAYIERLNQSSNVASPVNLMTHFSCADELNNPFTRKQIELFETLTHSFEGKRSLSNSAGVLAWPDAHSHYIRPGIMLYGVSPFEQHCAAEHGLIPAMTLSTRIIAIRDVKQGESVGYGAAWQAPKDTRIAILAIGYGDGYPRMAPNGTPTWIAGELAPLAGRPSMDMLTVDVGHLPDVKVGDRVVLWGQELPVEAVARIIGTIPYELVTKLTTRVEMRYIS